jgi:hypothetical protein
MSNDLGGDNKQLTDQRVTTSVTFGGSNWGIYMSNDFNYNLAGGNAGGDPTAQIYEAYASTDLMGFANLTVGRQALNYGSGALMSTNDWAVDRTTWDGMTFDFNLDAVSATLGYANRNAGELANEDATRTWANVAGTFSGFDVNFLYMSKSDNDSDTSDAAMGIDLSGEIAGATVMASLNTDYQGDRMTMVGLSYAVNDDMSIMASQTTMGDQGVYYQGGNLGSGPDSWLTHGNIGFQGANDQMITIGGSYTMGDFNLGVAMYNVTNDDDSEYERSASEVNLGYSLNDNSSLGLKIVNDDMGLGGDDVNFMWLTLNVGL